MSYKNSMKLFASNFNFVWKQLVYLICCILLLAISSYTTIRPIISLLAENNIGAEFEVLFQSIYNSPNEIGLMVSNVIRDILLVVFRNFGEIYLSFIFAILLMLFGASGIRRFLRPDTFPVWQAPGARLRYRWCRSAGW